MRKNTLRLVAMTLVGLAALCLLPACVATPVPVQQDPQWPAIERAARAMSADDAVATVTSCIRNYYHPKRLAVDAERYEMVLVNELIVSGGIQPSGYIPILLVRGDDIVIGQGFADVKGIQTSRWGAADDAICFWRPKRWAIHLSLESPVRPGIGKRAMLNCYQADRDRLLAALVRLCANLD